MYCPFIPPFRDDELHLTDMMTTKENAQHITEEEKNCEYARIVRSGVYNILQVFGALPIHK
jgi:hypothetical protein